MGTLIGYDRARKKANAGLRTCILTSIGAAQTMLISMYVYEMLKGPWTYAVELYGMKFDIARFSAQVMRNCKDSRIAITYLRVVSDTPQINRSAPPCSPSDPG